MTSPAARINDFRNAVVEVIHTAMPELRKCEPQFGRFNLDELETTSVRAPAVRFGILQAKIKSVASANADATLSCAAFIITEGKDRDAQAWVIAEAIAVLLHTGQMFGLVKVGTPANSNIQPVISAGSKSKGISIIAVEWSQELRELGANVFSEDGLVHPELYINGEAVDFEGDADV